jgi:Domain of unknown function (DUF4278)
MKLRFLGQTYSTSNNKIETIPSEYTARFRGKTYTPRRPVQAIKPQLVVKKYRGIAYSA